MFLKIIANRPAPDQRGATTIEAAVASGVFLILLTGLLNLFVLGFTAFTLHYSVTKATRWGILGSTGAYPSRFEAIEALVKSNVQRLGRDPSTVSVSVCPVLNPGCAGRDPGGSGQYFVIKAATAPRKFPGVGTFALQATVLAR